MKPANEWDEDYLQELISIGEQESLRLDYKASAALNKTDDKKNDLSKDVSAFANSDGGFLVYGMLEDGHVPKSIDVGVDRNVITKEWLESVIKSRISPIIDDIAVKQISLPSKGPNQVAYVVEIAQATSRAPHQAYDHKYYKRFNYQSTPMKITKCATSCVEAFNMEESLGRLGSWMSKSRDCSLQSKES